MASYTATAHHAWMARPKTAATAIVRSICAATLAGALLSCGHKKNDELASQPIAPAVAKGCPSDDSPYDPALGLPPGCERPGADSTSPEPASSLPSPASSTATRHVPYSRANPVLYSNDHPEDVHTDVLVMAMQSNGSINLRGIVTDQQSAAPSGCKGDGCHTAQIDDAYRREWIAAARESGFRSIPDSATGDAAVELIVREARKAEPSLPLVIMTGGPLALVARAYARDPSIASRVIVSIAAFSLNGDVNGKYRGDTNITTDLVSARTVLEHLRCVIVPFVDFNAKRIDQTRYPSTTRARVDGLPDKPLRRSMQSIYAYPWAHYDADGGPQATLLSPSYATGSKRVRWAVDDGGPYLAEDAKSDDVVITEVDGASVTEPWWSEVERAFSMPRPG